MDDASKAKAIAEHLRKMGDPRYGGTLPIGGKAYAGGPGSGPDEQVRDKPESFLTVRGAGEKAEKEAYDHEMNMKESELEDYANLYWFYVREAVLAPVRVPEAPILSFVEVVDEHQKP